MKAYRNNLTHAKYQSFVKLKCCYSIIESNVQWGTASLNKGAHVSIVWNLNDTHYDFRDWIRITTLDIQIDSKNHGNILFCWNVVQLYPFDHPAADNLALQGACVSASLLLNRYSQNI